MHLLSSVLQLIAPNAPGYSASPSSELIKHNPFKDLASITQTRPGDLVFKLSEFFHKAEFTIPDGGELLTPVSIDLQCPLPVDDENLKEFLPKPAGVKSQEKVSPLFRCISVTSIQYVTTSHPPKQPTWTPIHGLSGQPGTPIRHHGQPPPKKGQAKGSSRSVLCSRIIHSPPNTPKRLDREPRNQKRITHHI